MPPVPKTILSIPIPKLRSSGSLSFGSDATPTPCRIRFIDCRAFVEDDALKIVEFEEFPFRIIDGFQEVSYVAISYVWKGKEGDEEGGSFVVRYGGSQDCTEDDTGDPISISVLHSVCLAVLKDSSLLDFSINYVWLDRLCIMQTNKEDKSWQIRRMFEVYENSVVTIILPGGIQRLVGLNEETDWLQRAWTLQESLAPPNKVVLHRWEGDESNLWIKPIQSSGPGSRGYALTPLDYLVEACVEGKLTWEAGLDQTLDESRKQRRVLDDVKIIGLKGSPNLHAFLEALKSTHPNSSSLPGFGDYAIWKNALIRTSKRPVDMVFSIMKLFDVELNPIAYDENDRIGATIDLAREILSRPGRRGVASWIGVATRAPPCRQLSTFPEFPRTSVAGKALIKGVNAGTFVDEDILIAPGSGNIYSTEEYMIEGRIDEAGYLHFWGEGCAVTEVTSTPPIEIPGCAECFNHTTQHLSLKSVDGREWYFHGGVDLSHEVPKAAAIPAVAFKTFYGLPHDPGPITSFSKWMLVEEHATGKSHLTSYFRIPSGIGEELTWEEKEVLRIKERKVKFRFCVGGPDPDVPYN
ncbi:hypothetical protein VKT23_013344 [Stygiomarasmius scandens]|uniref:Heterokaryon incompatibility domain-containing protein n=1 Tax=Marasmiellus scandens TaxID=2682957 RepID=A0ABR1J5R3_9AGAR